MVTIPSQRFNYDEWVALARENPAAFEEMRQNAIESMIAAAPMRMQQRLRCLQWRIDMERKKCANPLSACLRLYSMMWDAVMDEHGFLSALQFLANPGFSAQDWTHAEKTAQILSFADHKQKNEPH